MRLTTNKDVSEMSMCELAHNSCYAKEGWARYRDYEIDIDARDLARDLLKRYADGDDAFTDDEDFGEYMNDALQYGMNDIEGLIALFYRNLWAMADLQERLKYYEDMEEQKKLLKLPCAVGDTVYAIEVDEENFTHFHCPNKISEYKFNLQMLDLLGMFGKCIFLTKEAAEAALKEMSE